MKYLSFISEEKFRNGRSPKVKKLFTSTDIPLSTPQSSGNHSHQFHSPNENHCCAHCPEIFQDGFTLQNHLQSDHGITLPYSCSLCGKGYLSSSGLYYHMQASHEKKSFQCPICDARFTRKGTIKSHLMGVHSAAQCPKCLTIVKFQDYNQHLKHCL